MSKFLTTLATVFILSLPTIALGEESDDEKSYWGRYDNGSWALTTVVDKPANFTFGWELPEANATKEAFEAERFNKDTLSPVNNSSVNFITKYGYSGDNSFYTHITESDSQIIYGRTNSTILIGSELLSPSEGKNNLCILAKANIQHEITWIKKLYEDKSYCWISDVASNQSEEIVVAGYYQNDQSKYIGFIKKYDNLGNLNFSKSYEGSSNVFIFQLGMSSNSEIVFNLSYGGNIVIDNKEYTRNIEENTFKSTQLLVKLDNTGNTLWINTLKAKAQFLSLNFDINSNDEIIVGGGFRGSLYNNSFREYMYNESNYGNKYQSALLAKFDTNGNLIWTKEVSGPNANWIQHLAVDSENNILFTLRHDGDATLDGTIISGYKIKTCAKVGVTRKITCSHSFSNTNNYAMVKLDTNGKLLWINEDEKTNGMHFKRELNFDQDDNIYFLQIDYGESYYSLFNQSNVSEVTYGETNLLMDDIVNGSAVNSSYEYELIKSVVKLDKHGNFIKKYTLNETGYDMDFGFVTYKNDSGYINNISTDSKGRVFISIKAWYDFEFGGISQTVKAESFEGNTYVFEISDN